jgi:aminopeptidase YwaD
MPKLMRSISSLNTRSARIWFAPLVVVLLTIAASGQKTGLSKPDASVDRIKSHVTYLASDKLEGRRTGGRGATFAAGYIANQFAAYRLKAPVSKSGKANFLQTFPYVTGVVNGKGGNEFDLNIGSGQKIKLENMLPVRPLGFSLNGTVPESKIIFAGFGITSDELKYDDYSGLDVRDKIVLVFDGTPENDNAQSLFSRFADIRVKAKIAKDKGARGLFVITRRKNFEDDPLAQQKFDQTLGEAAIPVYLIARNTAAGILSIKEEDLETVEGLTAMKADPAVKISTGLRPVTAVASFTVNLVKKQSPAYNVVGILEGTDPVLKKEAIVIGAHYDHLGRGGQGSLAVNSKEIHHGADDNASGVAALLELARTLSAEHKNKRTIIFIAFTGEEEGLLGSNYYVNNPVFPLDKTIAMFNMDMVGRLNDNKLMVGGVGTASEWKELLNSNNKSGFATSWNETPRNVEIVTKADNHVVYKTYPNFTLQLNEDGFGPSDHSSFYAKKVPVLFFFTGAHNDYHKPSDTADKINYEGLRQVELFVADLVRTVDQNPKRPTYAVAKSSGTGDGRRGFNVSIGIVPNYAEATDGLLVDGVRDDSPAAKAGLTAGDKIVRLAGKEVRNIQDYTIILGELKANTEYDIEIRRAGQKVSLKVTPAVRK